MDLTSILGLIGAIASISVGDILEGGNPLHLIHLSSLIIIIPTAGAAAVAATHGSHIKGALKEIKLSLVQPVLIIMKPYAHLLNSQL